ncbi:signal peptidase I [Paenarthrobacter nicotinovorans]|uniref:signal peptidase I n=1 Tax=Paenarthrobacter nicotinovorans TaxID=29320 RepID=UPI0037FBA60D
MPSRHQPSRRAARHLAIALVPTLLMLGIRAWLVEPVTVTSDSMEPAITQGSVVLMYKPATVSGPPRAGDIIAFISPQDGHTAIKRVVALGGQQLAIRDGELYVDGQHVPEPSIDHSRIDATYYGPIVIPPGTMFVLGDNRGVSIDSRDYGPVPLAAIQGSMTSIHR